MLKVPPQAQKLDPLQRQKRLQSLRESDQARKTQEAQSHQPQAPERQLHDPQKVSDPRQLHQVQSQDPRLDQGPNKVAGPEAPALQPGEAVALSPELSQDGAAPSEGHQGLEALLANFCHFGNQPKVNDQQDSQKVGQVQGLTEAQNHPKKQGLDLRKQVSSVKFEREQKKLGKDADKLAKARQASQSKSLDSKPRSSPAATVSPNQDSQRPGSKGAPKTDAPKPVGESQGGRGARPDQRLGPRLFQQFRIPTQDRVDLSKEAQPQNQLESPAPSSQTAPSESLAATGYVPQPRPEARNPLDFTRESFLMKVTPS